MFHDAGHFRVVRRGRTHKSTVGAFVAQMQIWLGYDLITLHTNTSKHSVPGANLPLEGCRQGCSYHGIGIATNSISDTF